VDEYNYCITMSPSYAGCDTHSGIQGFSRVTRSGVDHRHPLWWRTGGLHWPEALILGESAT